MYSFITPLDCRPEKEGIETGNGATLAPPRGELDCRPEKEGIETVDSDSDSDSESLDCRPEKEGIETERGEAFKPPPDAVRLQT